MLALVVFWTLEMAYLPTDGHHHAYGSFWTKDAFEIDAQLLIKRANMPGPDKIEYSCVLGEGDDSLNEYLRGRP
jgi:hypothetical protein